MKYLILRLSLICLPVLAFSQEYEAFEEKGKWGFKAGKKTVIKPRFDAASSFFGSSPRTTVKMGNKYGVIDRKGKWYIEPVLDSVLYVTFPHNYDLDGKWIIVYGKTYDYILNDYDYSKLDSFPEIRREILVREKNPDFNRDYSDPKDEYTTYLTRPDEPYVIVSDFDERKQPQSAVYELRMRKRISPWAPLNYGETLTVESFFMDTSVLYVYSNGTEKGYFMTGMDSGTPFKFSDVTVDGNFVLLREAKAGSAFQLYQWVGDHLLLLSGTNNVSVSQEEGSARYFYLLEDGNGKYGFVTMGGKVVDPQYDTIFRIPGYSDILQTRINGKYGLVSMASDYELQARSLEPIRIEGFNYSLFTTGIYLSYTDEKGKKWFADALLREQYAFNPKYVSPKAEKGFYYLTSMDTVAGKKVETRVLPIKFLKLQQTERDGTYIAQGTNKKYGIINMKGDTLFPFLYDELDLMNYDGDVFHYVTVKKNKKEYLYHWYLNQLIDLPFDEIKPLSVYSHDLSNLFIVSNKGKSGLLNISDSSMVFPLEFNKIYAKSAADKYGYFLIAGENSGYQAYFLENQFDDIKINTGNSKAYDWFFRDFGYIRAGDQFEEYNLYTHEKNRFVSGNEISWTVNDITIFYADGKFGVRNSRDEILFPAEYEKLYFDVPYQSDYISGTKEGKPVELNTEEMTETFR
ncbi:MAG: hypothetical protein K0R65_254 [Crocinitomicaceae bacterium]|jgi:hypothetical protein|nr:hypothetical protein [Crocinitomicaceae bacterium]